MYFRYASIFKRSKFVMHVLFCIVARYLAASGRHLDLRILNEGVLFVVLIRYTKVNGYFDHVVCGRLIALRAVIERRVGCTNSSFSNIPVFLY